MSKQVEHSGQEPWMSSASTSCIHIVPYHTGQPCPSAARRHTFGARCTSKSASFSRKQAAQNLWTLDSQGLEEQVRMLLPQTPLSNLPQVLLTGKAGSSLSLHSRSSDMGFSSLSKLPVSKAPQQDALGRVSDKTQEKKVWVLAPADTARTFISAQSFPETIPKREEMEEGQLPFPTSYDLWGKHNKCDLCSKTTWEIFVF